MNPSNAVGGDCVGAEVVAVSGVDGWVSDRVNVDSSARSDDDLQIEKKKGAREAECVESAVLLLRDCRNEGREE